jgi:hypothetical protein
VPKRPSPDRRFHESITHSPPRTDLRRASLVLEIPPRVLGGINDFWYRWVADVGITGADKGAGGKYVVLPPGYKGTVPAGYTVVRPSTYGNWLFFRAFLVDGSTKPGVELAKSHLKIYQERCPRLN